MAKQWRSCLEARRVKRWSAGALLAASVASAAFAQDEAAAPSTAEPDAESRPAAPEPLAASVPAEVVAAGAQVFGDTCTVCHGEDGFGGHGGGPPLDQVTDPAVVVATVTDGRGTMPALGELLTLEQIQAVAAYVTIKLFK
jgi:mono/diheme cytochrome c family protein